MDAAEGPIERLSFSAARLMADHPPIWRDPNKRIVSEISCPTGAEYEGEIRFSRWPALALVESVELGVANCGVEHRDGFFDYAPLRDLANSVEWHVNFADPRLFGFYGSSLFAQDEIQTAEHPALGALREALDARRATALTVERDAPTPILVMGVERRCHVATDRDAGRGRPAGLYGNAFARASPDVIRRATIPIEPPTISNFIAMAAPAGGRGRYSASEIAYILISALTAFRAAWVESRQWGAESVVVHTGFWGCGAFGGHRVLMAILQILAGDMAGLDLLVFHTGYGKEAAGAINAARSVVDLNRSRGLVSGRELTERLAALGFEWGVSDGN